MTLPLAVLFTRADENEGIDAVSAVRPHCLHEEATFWAAAINGAKCSYKLCLLFLCLSICLYSNENYPNAECSVEFLGSGENSDSLLNVHDLWSTCLREQGRLMFENTDTLGPTQNY